MIVHNHGIRKSAMNFRETSKTGENSFSSSIVNAFTVLVYSLVYMFQDFFNKERQHF